MNLIESSAQIIGDVKLGDGNYIGHNAILIGPLTIGDDNYIGAMVVIGTSAQDDILTTSEHRPEVKHTNSINIGSRNVIREFSTVHRGLISDTTLGDDIYLMSYSHIAHDCRIGNFVKVANAVQIAGFTTVGDYSYLGLSAVIHQFIVIGKASMVGMNSAVIKSVRPGSTVAGNPAKFIKPNTIGLQRIGISEVSWWSDHNLFPENYLKVLSQYDDEVSMRSSEAVKVREWRSRILEKKFN